MFCENCGTKNEQGAKFCENCGTNIATENVNPTNMQSNQNQFGGGVATQVRPEVQNTYASPIYANNLAFKNKKPITMKQKMIIALVGVVVVLFGIFYFIGSSMTNPERIAKGFFNSIMSYNFAKSYDYLDITNSEFTSREMYIKLMDNALKDSSKKEILNYNIKQADVNKALSGLSGLGDLLGGSIDKDSLKSASALMKYYTVEYTEKGTTSPKTEKIILIKQKSKSWLFFDSYKVAVDGIVAKTHNVYVPTGAKLFIDDFEVNKTNIVKEDKNVSNSYSKYGTDNYKITNIFTGTHNIKVTAPYMKDYESKISISNGLSTQVSDIEINADAISAMSKASEGLLKQIYASAIEGKGFDGIKSLLSTDVENLSNLESKYKSLASSIKKMDDTGLKAISFSNFKINSSNKKLSSDLTYQMNASFEYTYTQTSKNWDGSIYEYTADNPRNGSITVYFVYMNDKWLVSSFSPSVYY